MAAKNVDCYIAAAPEHAREKLLQLRNIITSAASKAEERISYGMPYYDYKGRLAYFGLHKKHIGLYVPPPVLEQNKQDLRNFETTKATVRLPLGEKLPVRLIQKLIRTRARLNEKHAASR